MNPQTQFVLEYCKFTSTFCLLAISAASWFFVKETEKTNELRWYHFLLAVGFGTALYSASNLVEVMKLAYLELSKTGADQNLISSDIKSAMNNVTFYLYGTIGSLGFFAAFQALCRKKVSAAIAPTIYLALLIFSNKSQAQTDEVNWVGSSNHPLVMLAKKQAGKVEVSQTISTGKLNVRPTKSLAIIEVYNNGLMNWYPVNLPQEGSFTSAQKVEMNWEKILRRADQISNCNDPIKLTVSLKKSTPRADLFIDNESWGKTDKYGSIKASLGSKCRNSVVSLDLKKNKCEEHNSQFKVDQDPKDYEETIKLKCS